MADNDNRDRVVVPLRPRAEYPFTGADAPFPVRARSTRADRVAAALAFVRSRWTGDFQVDEYGFDEQLTEALALPVLQVLYDEWLRVEVNGLAHVPSTGGALLVANHAGGLGAWDAAMTAVAVRTQHPAQRYLRLLADELIFRAPGLGMLARRIGATLACPADAERLLRAGELVGTQGFVACAAAAGVPIIPVSIVGARTPLGLVPLPSKWYLEFGVPISTSGCDPQDPAAIGELIDQVHDSIQTTQDRLVARRRPIGR